MKKTFYQPNYLAKNLPSGLHTSRRWKKRWTCQRSSSPAEASNLSEGPEGARLRRPVRSILRSQLRLEAEGEVEVVEEEQPAMFLLPKLVPLSSHLFDPEVAEAEEVPRM